jgi:hypothetical protein
MSWNYRVMTLNKGESYGIHEVYYREDGALWMYSANEISPYGEDIDELRKNLKWMTDALEKPVLTPQDFPEIEETQDACR